MMINNFKMKLVLLWLSTFFVLSACSGSSSSGKDAGDTVTVTHLERFDFSEGELVGTAEDDRFDFVASVVSSEETDADFILYRSGISHSDISDLGKGDFSLFSEIPDNYDTQGDDVFVDATVGHVYLFRMDDGFALMKITKVDDVGGDDEVEVAFTYQFKEEGDF